MLTNRRRDRTPEEEAEQRRELRRYWDSHPISTDSVPYTKGTRESFAAIYAEWTKGIDAKRLEFLAECRGKSVLEIGCGIGKDARWLTENGIDYRGLDYSLATLRLARQHFDYAGLPKRFVNGDATSLPFPDGRFDLVMSIGVLHHVPGVERACREAVRVTKPGGSLRVMFYARDSYHYFVVDKAVRPAIWAMLHFHPLEALLPLAPPKYRELYAISKQDGFSRERILATSADTSFPGKDNFIPVSGFFTAEETKALFPGLTDYRFFRSDLKYFPLPFLRGFVEKRWGFFLTMTARKPA